jgi:hypothetical protein
MPLVATNNKYHRQGMCRCLVDTIKKVLLKLLFVFLGNNFMCAPKKLKIFLMPKNEKFLV